MQSKGLSRMFSNTAVQKHQFLWCSAFFMVQLSHLYMTTGKTTALTRRTFVSKVMPLFFNMLSRFVVAFFSEEQAYFNFMAIVTICSNFGTQENTMYHCVHCLPIYLPWSDGIGCHDLSFLNVQGFFVCLFVFKHVNWRIIALQNFVVFCHISTRISHRYTHVPSFPNPPSSPCPPHPSACPRAPVWVLWAIQRIPIGSRFYIWYYKFPC